MVESLDAIDVAYDEIIFFIADQLQLYNKVSNAYSGATLKEILETFKLTANYYEERQRWLLHKVRNKVSERHSKTKWTILNVKMIIDSEFFVIFRNLLLMFHTIAPFKKDVKEAASAHCHRKKNVVSPEIEQQLSEAYIIEEIALNLRIRVLEDIQSEFYMGKNILPLLKLYSGQYGIDVFTLTETSIRKVQFQFFQLIKSESKLSWQPRFIPS